MKSDIVDVISGYMRLQRKGVNYFGLCPSHNEKSPSFSVSPGKQIYYCFGYGVEENVLTFVMGYENYTFQEALSHLADRAGVNLPKMEYNKETREQAERRARLLEVNRLAANYFYYQLKVPQGRVEYECFYDKRDLSDDTIACFGLGYFNRTSDDPHRFSKDKRYEGNFLKDTGLVILEERGGRDKFWNRVTLPIVNTNNHVIGFGERVMGNEEPKYLDSPEIKLFDKSRSLCGLDYARTSGEGHLLICKGHLDVTSLHQAGFANTVASLGTASTSQHANALRCYTDQVILTYDSDGVGIKAALRTIPTLREVEISIEIPNVKPHKDPDESTKNLESEVFRQKIKEAKNSSLSEVNILRQSYQTDDPEQKTKFYQETTRKLLQFGEALEREDYLQAVIREQMIPVDGLRGLINHMSMSSGMRAGDHMSRSGQVRRNAPAQEEAYFENDPYQSEDNAQDGRNSSYGERGADQAKRPERPDKEDEIRRPQRLLLTWLIETLELLDKIRGIITADDFMEDLYHQMVQVVLEGQVSGNLNPAVILSRFINGEDQYKEVAVPFSASLKESFSSEEQKRASSGTVVKVQKDGLDTASCNAKDITQLQEIIGQQVALKQLYISLD